MGMRQENSKCIANESQSGLINKRVALDRFSVTTNWRFLNMLVKTVLIGSVIGIVFSIRLHNPRHMMQPQSLIV
jgi:hypothetical protein